MTERLGTIDNSRTPEQRASMEATVGQGTCPFCELNRNINKPMWEEDYTCWWVWENPFPYSGHSRHFVIALKRHETDYLGLTHEEGLEKFLIEQRLIGEFDLPGGGLVTRFGNPEHNAGTITHIHAHVQVPDKQGFAIAVFFKDDRLATFLAPK